MRPLWVGTGVLRWVGPLPEDPAGPDVVDLLEGRDPSVAADVRDDGLHVRVVVEAEDPGAAARVAQGAVDPREPRRRGRRGAVGRRGLALVDDPPRDDETGWVVQELAVRRLPG